MARKADGSAGARRAAALIGIAACAQTATATLDEEAGKIDLKFTFKHAFERDKVLTCHAQVKSGLSYRAASSTRSTLTLNIDKETIEALSGPVLSMIVWVPPAPVERMYWYPIDPRGPIKTPPKISRQQYLRPSLLYDLTRLSNYGAWSRSFPKQTVANIAENDVMLKARRAYSALKRRQLTHPLIGPLRATRLAWRHVTRRSKAKSRRILSLRVVPHLKAFLSAMPDRLVVGPATIIEVGRRSIETRYILCWYHGALTIGGKSHYLLLRIKEEISYPTEWDRYPLGRDDIRHEATLASWWCKEG